MALGRGGGSVFVKENRPFVTSSRPPFKHDTLVSGGYFQSSVKYEVQYFNLFVASFGLFICQIVTMQLMEDLFTKHSYLIIVTFIILIFQAGAGTKGKPLQSSNCIATPFSVSQHIIASSMQLYSFRHM